MEQRQLLPVLCVLLVVLWQRRADSALQVQPPSVLLGNSEAESPRQLTAHTHMEALFHCLEVFPDSPPHRPDTEVVWLKDGAELDTSSRKYRNYGKKKQLLVTEVRDEDAGVYECARSLNSTERGRAELWIGPRILSAPSPQLLEAGVAGSVECVVSGGVRVVEWWRGGELLVSSLNETISSSTYTLLPSGSLHLPVIEPRHSGLYFCRVSNQAGVQSSEIRVHLAGYPLPEDEEHMPPPMLIIPTPVSRIESVPIYQSDSSTEECLELLDISFEVPPTFSIPTTDPNHNSSTGGPAFTTEPPSCVRTNEGYTITLPCSVNTGTVTWSHDGILVGQNTSGHCEQLDGGSLKINSVRFQDRGLYQCAVQGTSLVSSVRVRVTAVTEVCGEVEGVRGRRVAEGQVVDGAKQWPWQVLLEYASPQPSSSPPDDGGSGSEQLCGGALVRADWVLTAAHCLLDGSSWRQPSDLVLRAGVYNRSAVEHHQQLLEVEHYVAHPSYLPPALSPTSTPEHDLALLKLKHPVRLTSHAVPVCLPPNFDEPPEGTLCVVTGWGHMEFGNGTSPELLHMAQVPLVSYSHCRSSQSYGTRITRNMLCAGWQQGGADSCQNDSGGPLVCLSDDHSSTAQGRWGVYGVVNSGEGCGAPHKYGIYARITHYIRWINRVLRTEL